ncbi:hypothetical protein [Hymenobacter cavernae]|uniref:Tetratricopeptide repeat protein n=1 Tax=Hymenobacter cavernae TaxID=2044852 RepID=A0ABQ1TK85_9BACT|nr:hypothetical protein [Hymenobacter cavernae]GGE94897.1 hypothetical protein GCM10011383_02020 [Hymenobacter cavernae]
MAPPSPLPTDRPVSWRSPLLVLGLVAGLALALACYYYFTGDDHTFPIQPIAQLTPVPTTLPPVRVGLAELPVRVNGYLVAQTYDVAGPYVQPAAAAMLLLLLAVCLVYYLAVVSTLARTPFVVTMGLLIFLLMSLNADQLGVFDTGKQYFLITALLILGLPAYGFHAFWPDTSLRLRLLAFAVLIASLVGLLLWRSDYPAPFIVLHLASYFTAGSAVVVGLLAFWVSFENIYALLWFNTQAENPKSRFGLWPFLLTSGLYLGILLMYYLNDGEVLLLAGLHLDPFVLLLPAVLVGWLGLRQRAATYSDWVPYWPSAAHLYLMLTALAAGSLAYAFATANDPLLEAGRSFVGLVFLTGGIGFLLYVLINFAPLIRQRLRVYRVVYEPRRLPFYVVLLFALGALVAVEARNDFFVLDQVEAGYYNNLGDLTRLQSEQQPQAEALALLAERYYAESDVLDRYNRKASFGRAALYRFRAQRQNEINALRRALSRRPSEKVSLRLAALYMDQRDFFDRLQVLREGLKAHPRSAFLANDLAQLYTRSTLTDSVATYQARAEAVAPDNLVLRANKLAFLLKHQQWKAAQTIASESLPNDAVALQANALLLSQLTGKPNAKTPAPLGSQDLAPADFAQVYHAALNNLTRRDTSLLPTLTKLAQRPANASYFEQLTFLRALTQYYGGQAVAAQVTLLPLTIGTGPEAAYYHSLWGTWLLDQRLYSSAAARLAVAAQGGYTEAALPRAYSFALNGQLDSARTLAQLAAQEKDALVAHPAHSLLQVLALDFNRDYRLASDSVKAQYLVIRGASLYPESLIIQAAALRSPAAREAALLAQIPRALQVGQVQEAREAIQRFAPDATAKTTTVSAWNVLRGQLYTQEKVTTELRQLLQTAYFSPADQSYKLYYQATLARLQKQLPAAARLYAQLGRQASLLEPAMLSAADFYAEQRNYTAAYSLLQQALAYNPESATLLKAYAMTAVSAGLADYAEEPLAKLRTLLSPAEYATFRQQYDARHAAQLAETAPWK